jgi:hypothetical protein
MASKKSSAKAVTGKKATAAGKAAVEEAPAPKPHERKTKPSEKDRIEKGRELVAGYLIQRDGMDPQIAVMVVANMEAEEINALIEEANTAVLDRGKDAPATEPAPATESGAGFTDDDSTEFVDFTEIPELAASEEFAVWVFAAADNSKVKNAAEKAYKEDKAKIIALMKDTAKIKRTSCGGIKLTVYPGETKWIDERMLLEQGVPIETIKKCWKSTPWWDVRFTMPKVPK